MTRDKKTTVTLHTRVGNVDLLEGRDWSFVLRLIAEYDVKTSGVDEKGNLLYSSQVKEIGTDPDGGFSLEFSSHIDAIEFQCRLRSLGYSRLIAF